MKKNYHKTFTCLSCGKKFVDYAITNRRYCSKQCQGMATWNEKFSDIKPTDTKCWTCKNTNDSCPWFSANPKPVEGWTAERKDYKQSNGELCDTYIVRECPNYEKAR